MVVLTTPLAMIKSDPALTETESTSAATRVTFPMLFVPFSAVAVITTVPPTGTKFGAVKVVSIYPAALVVPEPANKVPSLVRRVMDSFCITLPEASLAVALTVAVELPSAVKLFGVTTTTTSFTGPAIKATLAEPLTPPIDAVTSAVPIRTELVRATLADPFIVLALAVAAPPVSVPRVVENDTSVPSGIRLLSESYMEAVIKVVTTPPALICEFPALTLTYPTYVFDE